MDKLCNRDRKMLQLIVEGKSNREVAEAVNLTEGTARVYLHNLYHRMGVKGRTQAAMAWMKMKGLDPNKPAGTLVENFLALGAEIHRNKVAHQWKVTTREDWAASAYEVPGVLMLITSEVAEALEAFRKDDFKGFSEELADVVIRVVGLAHGLGIDLGVEVEKKVLKNRKRPVKHGGKRV